MTWPQDIFAGFFLISCSNLLKVKAKTLSSPADSDIPKIAIVGGGVGGTASAYFARQLFGRHAVIDLYETGIIGGRLTSVSIAGREYEAGGSILHPDNKYMVDFAKLFGLKKKDKPDLSLGLYDGDKVVFETSTWSAVTIPKLIWRYGLDAVNINFLVSRVIKKFSRVYDHQEKGHAFTTPDHLLHSMDGCMVEYMGSSLKETLTKEGYGTQFIDEIAGGGIRGNYGQSTTNLHGFVGMISMAGIAPGLWSVHGGNKLIPEGLLERSGANHLSAEVTQVNLLPDKEKIKYDVKFIYNDLKDTPEPMISSRQYDIVVIAAPLHPRCTDIMFSNFPKPITFFKHDFHRTVATFVEGTRNASYFGYKSVKDMPHAVLSFNHKFEFFNSVAENYPVDWQYSESKLEETKKRVYKIFSQKPLSKSELETLFSEINEVKVMDWLAYPEYSHTVTDLPPFELHKQLYYANAIEIAASTAETSIIGARNVMLLAYNKWKGISEKIDNAQIIGDMKKAHKATKSEL